MRRGEQIIACEEERRTEPGARSQEERSTDLGAPLKGLSLHGGEESRARSWSQ